MLQDLRLLRRANENSLRRPVLIARCYCKVMRVEILRGGFEDCFSC